jgi:hypothetical protein
VASCPPVDGYVWSEVFPVETSFIHTILPAADGNYIIGGVLDDDGGTWVAVTPMQYYADILRKITGRLSKNPSKVRHSDGFVIQVG